MAKKLIISQYLQEHLYSNGVTLKSYLEVILLRQHVTTPPIICLFHYAVYEV